MNKIKGFEIVDRCLYWKAEKTLIVGDLHLGYEDVLFRRGASFPRRQLDETLEIFKKVFEKTGKVERVILLGDVKHYFAGVLREEFEDFFNVLELIKKNLRKEGKVIITKGNHDNILKPISTNYKEVELLDYFVLKNVLFFHGDKFGFEKVKKELGKKKIKRVVVGHFHPALILSDNVKREKYKCFLLGEVFEKDFIFVPSFFPLVEGSDINSEVKWNFDLKKKKIFVLSPDGEVFEF